VTVYIAKCAMPFLLHAAVLMLKMTGE